MAYSTIATFTTGETVTAAKMNQVKDDIDYLYTGSGARVYNNADISIANATTTALTFNTERFDTETYHSTSSVTGRLVAPVTGLYLITGHIRFAANATGERRLMITLGGTTDIAYVSHSNNAAIITLMTVATIYQLSATNYVELRAYQSSGGSLNVEAIGNYSPEFSIVRL